MNWLCVSKTRSGVQSMNWKVLTRADPDYLSSTYEYGNKGILEGSHSCGRRLEFTSAVLQKCQRHTFWINAERFVRLEFARGRKVGI
jgi:hypothetical protein